MEVFIMKKSLLVILFLLCSSTCLQSEANPEKLVTALEALKVRPVKPLVRDRLLTWLKKPLEETSQVVVQAPVEQISKGLGRQIVDGVKSLPGKGLSALTWPVRATYSLAKRKAGKTGKTGLVIGGAVAVSALTYYVWKWASDYSEAKKLGRKLRVSSYDEQGTAKPLTRETFKFYNWRLRDERFCTALEINENPDVLEGLDEDLSRSVECVFLKNEDGTPFTRIVVEPFKGATVATQIAVISTINQELQELDTEIKKIAPLDTKIPFSDKEVIDRCSATSSLSEAYILNKLGQSLQRDFCRSGAFDYYVKGLTKCAFDRMVDLCKHANDDSMWSLSSREKEKIELYIYLIARKVRLQAILEKVDACYGAIKKKMVGVDKAKRLIRDQQDCIDRISVPAQGPRRVDIEQLKSKMTEIYGICRDKWREPTEGQRVMLMGLTGIISASTHLINIFERGNAAGHEAQRSKDDATICAYVKEIQENYQELLK